MLYYYLTTSSIFYEQLGTSKLGISSDNLGLSYTPSTFLNYTKPIIIRSYAEDRSPILGFPKYSYWYDFICCTVPEIRMVMSQFNIPNHRWYQAIAKYDLDFINDMKNYFNIEYHINPNEKRDYWILQILNKRREELVFDQMEFNVVNFRDRKSVLRPFDAKINSMEEFNRLGKEIYLKTKRNDIIEDIDSPVYVYRKNYDILWGGTQIVFNEKVKAALEATHIITPQNGLEFVEFTEYKIEMLGENG